KSRPSDNGAKMMGVWEFVLTVIPTLLYLRGNNCISEMEAYRLSNNGLEFTFEPRPYMVFRVLNTKIPNCLIIHTQERRQGKMYNTIAL
ncbi:hypothetical protein chiPu_0025372, partial [Chiloscyllium punctatum]|nr:hypothetical protein [Chiloscyllium punctatum]